MTAIKRPVKAVNIHESALTGIEVQSRDNSRGRPSIRIREDAGIQSRGTSKTRPSIRIHGDAGIQSHGTSRMRLSIRIHEDPGI